MREYGVKALLFFAIYSIISVVYAETKIYEFKSNGQYRSQNFNIEIILEISNADVAKVRKLNLVVVDRLEPVREYAKMSFNINDLSSASHNSESGVVKLNIPNKLTNKNIGLRIQYLKGEQRVDITGFSPIELSFVEKENFNKVIDIGSLNTNSRMPVSMFNQLFFTNGINTGFAEKMYVIRPGKLGGLRPQKSVRNEVVRRRKKGLLQALGQKIFGPSRI